MHYRNRKLCRVLRTLLSFFISGTRQRMSLPSAQTRTIDNDTTLGKASLCRVLRVGTRQRRHLCRVLRHATRQRLSLPSVNVSHSANFGPPLNQPAAVSSLPSVQMQHSAKRLFAECQKQTLGKV